MFNLKFVGDINESDPTFLKIGMENINFEEDFNLITIFLKLKNLWTSNPNFEPWKYHILNLICTYTFDFIVF